jgi:hypothetical protein
MEEVNNPTKYRYQNNSQNKFFVLFHLIY